MKKEKIISLKKLMLFIILLWIVSTLIVKMFFGDWSKSGSFGDTFGAINSLFSGLALAGIIYTIYLQKTELSLQREELKYTREELKRTADAQESSVKMMNEQLRINNIPFFDFSSKIINSEPCVLITNKSNNPAFNVDIWLFFSQFEDENPFREFVKENVIGLFQENYLTKELKLIDGETWGIVERGISNFISKESKIKIPINYSLELDYFEIFIQYCDSLGNNYFQILTFTNSDKNTIPYLLSELRPSFPKTIERIDFSDESCKTIKNLNKDIFRLFNKKESSISASSLIKSTTGLCVENRWEII